MRRNKKLNKAQALVNRQRLLEKTYAGEGLYEFQNRHKGDLSLPKPTQEGKLTVPPLGKFKGDSYFLKMVGKDLSLVKTIEAAGAKTMADKLILDQPDQVTPEGKVEHVVSQPNVSLNETPANNSPKPSEVLLNEDPLEGVQIILE